MPPCEEMNQAPEVTTRDDGYVQDLASQWVAERSGGAPGERVLDLCAAPGGKATAMAGTGATVVAADLRPTGWGWSRRTPSGSGATGVVPLVADAAHPPFRPGVADVVLLDAPCSGLGVLRRRPDARWRLEPDAPGAWPSSSAVSSTPPRRWCARAARSSSACAR